MTDQPRRGRPPTRTAVINAVLEQLTEERRPAPTERQLRRWMQEGTLPKIDRVEDITPQFLYQCSQLVGALGRGNKASHARIAEWVNGRNDSEDRIRADILSALNDYNLGSIDGLLPNNIDDEEIVSEILTALENGGEGIGAQVVRLVLNNVRLNRGFEYLLNSNGNPSVLAGDAWDETPESKRRALIHNLLSAAKGSGVYWPAVIVQTVDAILRSIGINSTPEELEAVAAKLQDLFDPSPSASLGQHLESLWNRVIVEGIKTVPLGELLPFVRDPRVAISVRVLPYLADPNTDLNSPRYTLLSIVYALFRYRVESIRRSSLGSGDES